MKFLLYSNLAPKEIPLATDNTSSAGASQQLGNTGGTYDPYNGFADIGANSGWCSDKWTSDDQGVIIWYQFDQAMIPSQVSFSKRPYDSAKTETPKEFEFVVSNDVPCKADGNWITAKKSSIGSINYAEYIRKVDEEKIKEKKAFVCFGLRVTEPQSGFQDMGDRGTCLRDLKFSGICF